MKPIFQHLRNKIAVVAVCAALSLGCSRSHAKVEGAGFVTVTKRSFTDRFLPLDLGIGDENHWRIIWHTINFVDGGGIRVVNSVAIFTATLSPDPQSSYVRLFAAATNGVVYDISHAFHSPQKRIATIFFDPSEVKCIFIDQTHSVATYAELSQVINAPTVQWKDKADNYNKWKGL